MELTLENRTAVITGGSLGIGMAMATAFYAAGARVAIIARRPEALALARQAILNESAPAGARIETFVCDVADNRQLQTAYADIVAALGPVDVLVNNAGKAAVKPFVDITDAEWQDDIDLKLMAAIRLTRLAWR